ncbi:MAG TPA: Uma2 family endonuclease [Streptosporangiaceae bacterium]|nr:Uma2 family endonuclease [Streptosporangiaceae bacterium]
MLTVARKSANGEQARPRVVRARLHVRTVSTRWQRGGHGVIARLTAVLTAACADDLVVLPGVGMRITRYQYREPDIAVVPADSFETRNLERPPALAVEVASPSTRLYDRNRRKDVYESFGIPAYWIIEPDRDSQRLVVFELRDGKYEQVAEATGDEPFSAGQPFPVTIRPSALVRTGALD